MHVFFVFDVRSFPVGVRTKPGSIARPLFSLLFRARARGIVERQEREPERRERTSDVGVHACVGCVGEEKEEERAEVHHPLHQTFPENYLAPQNFLLLPAKPAIPSNRQAGSSPRAWASGARQPPVAAEAADWKGGRSDRSVSFVRGGSEPEWIGRRRRRMVTPPQT